MTVEAYRTRLTRMEWRFATSNVSVTWGLKPTRWGETSEPEALMFGFWVDVAGGGRTALALTITPDSFDRVLAAMMRVDRSACERALRAVMAEKR